MKMLKKIFLSLFILSLSVFGIFYIQNEKNKEITFSTTAPTQTSVIISISTPNPIVSSFSFAVISDIHGDLPSLKKTLGRIKNDKMDFIIVAGDLTSLGRINELQNVKGILDKSGIIYYVIPGNHDLWSVRGGDDPFEEVFGADYQSFARGKVKFILINNGDRVIGVDKKQQSWLDNEIADCPRLYCLIFAHMPLNNSLTAHIMGEGDLKVASQAALLIKKFNDYKVKELFAAHIHYLSNYTLDGLQTNTAGAIFTDNSSSTPRFLEVTVSLPEIKLEKKEVWLTDEPVQ